jgi:drug/metabolite transporter (DMT)-like permease
LLGVTLALTASLSWGCADFLGGLTARKMAALAVVFLSQVIALSVFAVVMLANGAPPPDGDFLIYAILSGACEAIALSAFYKGLSLGAMGVVAPIAAAAAVVPVIVGFASGEAPTALASAGMLAAIAGVIMVSREKTEARPKAGLAAGAGLAAVAALGFGTFYVLIGEATERADPLWAVFANRITLVSLLGAVMLATRPKLPALRPNVRALAAIGCLDVSGSLLYATATGHGLTSVIGTLGSLYPVVTVILARVFLTERLALPQRIGAGLVIVGVCMLGRGA